MKIPIHEEKNSHFTFHGGKKGPITSHENTLYHPLHKLGAPSIPATIRKILKWVQMVRKFQPKIRIQWKFPKMSIHLASFRKFWKMLFHSSPWNFWKFKTGIFHRMKITDPELWWWGKYCKERILRGAYHSTKNSGTNFRKFPWYSLFPVWETTIVRLEFINDF